MPSTPSHLKLGFQRNAYSRVSYGKSFQEQEKRTCNEADGEPLQGRIFYSYRDNFYRYGIIFQMI